MALVNRTTDYEIRSIPAGISAKADADWLGVSVERVEAVRAEAQPKQRPGIAKSGPAVAAIDEGKSAQIGSMNLLRAQLRYGQHDITDKQALATLKAFAGVA